ncbi:MAG: hypothetical protein KYX68_11200 [Flavobacterium sp.]|nr:hypothetical protein [Flavobacterium sp.]
MSTNSQDQEIDLGQIFHKVGGFFQSIVDKLFDFILFVKRNSLYLAGLLIIGLVFGYFLDKQNKTYDHEIIVTPNFGSVDYLYSKIALLDAKRRENDTLFFSNLGFKDIKTVGTIKVEPIIDIYKFIEGKPGNFELIKLMAEEGDINNIVKDPVTSKNYPYHTITFKTNGLTDNNKTINPLLNFLNDSEYYSKLKEQYLENQKEKLSSNDSIINQIDNLLNEFSNTVSDGSKSDKLIYYSDNNQLDAIINTKNTLTIEKGSIKLNIINSDKIIKDISSTINMKSTKGILGKMKIVVPVVFLFLFFVFVSVKNFYRNQLAKRNLA